MRCWINCLSIPFSKERTIFCFCVSSPTASLHKRSSVPFTFIQLFAFWSPFFLLLFGTGVKWILKSEYEALVLTSRSNFCVHLGFLFVCWECLSISSFFVPSGNHMLRYLVFFFFLWHPYIFVWLDNTKKRIKYSSFILRVFSSSAVWLLNVTTFVLITVAI